MQHDKEAAQGLNRNLWLATFVYQFFKGPGTVGAIAPSSQALAKTMLRPVEFSAAPVIVELGPGTGPITDEIARNLALSSNYIGIEVNEEFVAILRSRFPHLKFFHSSAEDIKQILSANGMQFVDVIISSLPWASLPIDQQDRIFAAMLQCLRPGSLFISFAYLQGLLLPAARVFRKRLHNEFSTVKTSSIVWRNIPPALAYICVR